MKIDGHIHTPFCPHGSTDSLEQYVEKAIHNGFTQITFTEHAPLPKNFVDPTPLKDSGMDWALLDDYFTAVSKIKSAYKKDIHICVGLEVDYIDGFEYETTEFLNEYGSLLDDSILSVHFLKANNKYTCIDYSKEVYLQFANQIGNVESMYNQYYDTVLKSVHADLGQYKPKRIGHPTLIQKFQLAHNEIIDDSTLIKNVLLEIKNAGYSVDLNSAGLRKKDCLQSYPPSIYIPFMKEMEIPFVFGSDAHVVVDLHADYDIVMK